MISNDIHTVSAKINTDSKFVQTKHAKPISDRLTTQSDINSVLVYKRKCGIAKTKHAKKNVCSHVFPESRWPQMVLKVT